MKTLRQEAYQSLEQWADDLKASGKHTHPEWAASYAEVRAQLDSYRRIEKATDAIDASITKIDKRIEALERRAEQNMQEGD